MMNVLNKLLDIDITTEILLPADYKGISESHFQRTAAVWKMKLVVHYQIYKEISKYW